MSPSKIRNLLPFALLALAAAARAEFTFDDFSTGNQTISSSFGSTNWDTVAGTFYGGYRELGASGGSSSGGTVSGRVMGGALTGSATSGSGGTITALYAGFLPPIPNQAQYYLFQDWDFSSITRYTLQGFSTTANVRARIIEWSNLDGISYGYRVRRLDLAAGAAQDINLNASTVTSTFGPFDATKVDYLQLDLIYSNAGSFRLDGLTSDLAPSPVPEPATMLALGGGLIALARRRRN